VGIADWFRRKRPKDAPTEPPIAGEREPTVDEALAEAPALAPEAIAEAAELHRLACALRDEGRFVEALDPEARAVAILDGAGEPPRSELHVHALLILAELRHHAGDAASGLALCERAAMGAERALGETHPRTVQAATLLASLYGVVDRAHGRDPARYVEQARHAFQLAERAFPEASEDFADACVHFGVMLGRVGEPAEASQVLRRAVAILRELPPTPDSDALALGAIQTLVAVHEKAGDWNERRRWMDALARWQAALSTGAG